MNAQSRGGSRASNKGGANVNICTQNAREKFWPCPLLRNHTHLIAVKQGYNQKTWKNQWNSSFCPYRQVCQSDCKFKSDQGFLARRGVLELAMSIEACMLSWLEGGCLSTQSTPLDPPLQSVCTRCFLHALEGPGDEASMTAAACT